MKPSVKLWAAGLTMALLGAAAVAQTPAAPAAPANDTWPMPDPEKLAAGPYKDTVLYGRKLFTETYATVGPEVKDAAMRYAGNNLSCENCHIDGGRQRYALPLIGVYGAFPTYMARENEVRTIEERINGCFERSMSGKAIPVGGKEMKALVSYIQFLSLDIPIGKTPQGRGSPALPMMTRAADPKKGLEAFNNYCAECHGDDGLGVRNGEKGDAKGYMFPPLWGPDSYNDGAGMHRVIASASFIHANMPFGTHYDKPLIAVEEAWDVAAYINSQPRPKMAGLDKDYPNRARKPVDAPFPPYVGNFTPEQHKYGPFKPMLDAQTAASPR
jgi:thiosulfate dehydrogenase